MTALAQQTAARAARRPLPDGERGRWWRFTLLAVITALVIVPLAAVVLLSLQPALGSAATGLTIENYLTVITSTDLGAWVANSLLVTLATVAVAVVIAAPAGYVLSRGRGRLVAGFSLTLFVIQSLPVVTAIIPLFILFAGIGLVDSLGGIVILYVGGTMSVAIWMMAAYFDSIPISLEEAAWMDGCSVFGSFWRVVLRNSLPGVLSTAIFAFLLAWNDYLVAVIFLRSDQNYTLPIGLQTLFQQNQTDWGPVMSVAVVMMIPPIIVFAVLNRYFSVGGIGGSLAGR